MNQLPNRYNELASSHPVVSDDRRIYSSYAQYVLHLTHLKAYQEAARRWPGRSFLDWGCNDGYGIERLLSTASRVAGVDSSLECAIAAAHRVGAKARIYHVQLPLGNNVPPIGPFDVVTVFQVIEHVHPSDYPALFLSIIDLLSPQGCVFWSTPNAARRLQQGERPWNPHHVVEFRADELEALFRQWFESVELEGLWGTDRLMEIDRTRIETRKAKHTGGRGAGEESAATAPTREECASEFSTDDLWLQASDLDGAIDLFASCRRPRRAR